MTLQPKDDGVVFDIPQWLPRGRQQCFCEGPAAIMATAASSAFPVIAATSRDCGDRVVLIVRFKRTSNNERADSWAEWV